LLLFKSVCQLLIFPKKEKEREPMVFRKDKEQKGGEKPYLGEEKKGDGS